MNKLSILGDIVILMASFFWLVDYTPIDGISDYNSAKSAIEKLMGEHTIVRSSPIEIKDNKGEKIEPDDVSFKALRKVFEHHASLPHSLDWNKVVGFTQHTLRMPAQEGGAIAFRTFNLVLSEDNKQIAPEFIAAASQNDFGHWLQRIHQENIVIFIGALLSGGFLCSLFAKLFS